METQSNNQLVACSGYLVNIDRHYPRGYSTVVDARWIAQRFIYLCDSSKGDTKDRYKYVAELLALAFMLDGATTEDCMEEAKRQFELARRLNSRARLPWELPGETLRREACALQRMSRDDRRRNLLRRAAYIWRGIHPHCEAEAFGQMVDRLFGGAFSEAVNDLLALEVGPLTHFVEAWLKETGPAMLQAS